MVPLETPPPWLPLPRVRAGRGPAATAMAAGALLLIAGLGAVLVHVAEYHVGLGTVGGRPASLAFMLANCPVRGELLAVIVVTLVALIALLLELRALAHRQRRLTSTAGRLRLGATPSPARKSLQPGRLVALFLPLLCAQLGLYALVERCLPMTVSMSMHGVVMNMAVRSTLPLLPMHLVVALLLAVFVWRLEHRLVVLHAVIDAVQRLLRQALRAPRRVPLPLPSPVAQLSRRCGPGALSRPPPA